MRFGGGGAPHRPGVPVTLASHIIGWGFHVTRTLQVIGGTSRRASLITIWACYSPPGEKLSGWVDLGHRVLAAWIFRAMPGRRFSSIAPGTPPHRPGLAAPDSRDHKLLTAVRGLSRQLARFAADVNEQLTAVNAKLHSIDERMTALEEVVNSRACVEEKRKRRAHNPKIAVCMCACMRRVR